MPGWYREIQRHGCEGFGISADNTPSQREFAVKNNITAPFPSDFAKREVAKVYGVPIESAGVANRATSVIDKDGKILHIEEGHSAIDPTGAADACSRAAHRGQ